MATPALRYFDHLSQSSQDMTPPSSGLAPALEPHGRQASHVRKSLSHKWADSSSEIPGPSSLRLRGSALALEPSRPISHPAAGWNLLQDTVGHSASWLESDPVHQQADSSFGTQRTLPQAMSGTGSTQKEALSSLGSLAPQSVTLGLTTHQGASASSEIPESFRVSGRSEERRVGKECRSRWSPYH